MNNVFKNNLIINSKNSFRLMPVCNKLPEDWTAKVEDNKITNNIIYNSGDRIYKGFGIQGEDPEEVNVIKNNFEYGETQVFVNPEENDFRVKYYDPWLKREQFKPIDIGKIGLKTDFPFINVMRHDFFQEPGHEILQ